MNLWIVLSELQSKNNSEWSGVELSLCLSMVLKCIVSLPLCTHSVVLETFAAKFLKWNGTLRAVVILVESMKAMRLQRLRQRRINAYQQSNRPRSEMSHYPSSYYQNTLGILYCRFLIRGFDYFMINCCHWKRWSFFFEVWMNKIFSFW